MRVFYLMLKVTFVGSELAKLGMVHPVVKGGELFVGITMAFLPLQGRTTPRYGQSRPFCAEFGHIWVMSGLSSRKSLHK